MSLPIIEIITANARVESAQTNKEVVSGIVAPLQKTFGQITYYIPKPTFFTRQCTIAEEPERWNIFGRFEWYLSGVYFTDESRGEILLAKLENFIAWIRSVAKGERNPFKKYRTFWEIEHDASILLANCRKKYLEGDYRAAEQIALQFQACGRELTMEIAEMRRAANQVKAGEIN